MGLELELEADEGGVGGPGLGGEGRHGLGGREGLGEAANRYNGEALGCWGGSMAQDDNTCKVLVEQFTADIVTWLLGEPIALTRLESTELLVDPIQTDSLVLLGSEDLILHLEFQVEPKPELPFRMLDYRV